MRLGNSRRRLLTFICTLLIAFRDMRKQRRRRPRAPRRIKIYSFQFGIRRNWSTHTYLPSASRNVYSISTDTHALHGATLVRVRYFSPPVRSNFSRGDSIPETERTIFRVLPEQIGVSLLSHKVLRITQPWAGCSGFKRYPHHC